VKRSRRCWMLPYACVPWHCGVWDILRCWFLLTRGLVSGSVDVFVCWLIALALNGLHMILIIFHCWLCVFDVCPLFLFGLRLNWYTSGLLDFEPSHTIAWCCGGFWMYTYVPLRSPMWCVLWVADSSSNHAYSHGWLLLESLKNETLCVSRFARLLSCFATLV